MKPLIVSRSDSEGGAARAAVRLHGALLRHGVASRMAVRERRGDQPAVEADDGVLARMAGLLRPLAGNAIGRLQRDVGRMPRSGNWLPSNWSGALDAAGADVANLHWVAGETLSIADIGRLRTPQVWTLHDMWAFCGCEHYAPDDAAARWRTGYRPDNRQPGAHGIDLDRYAWRRKQRAWRMPLQVVAPSRWLADCAAHSALLAAHTVHCIPNPLDTDRFRPLDRVFCRDALGLPPQARIVLFGAIGGGSDPRKGYDLLDAALQRLAQAHPEHHWHAAVFGAARPAQDTLPVPSTWFGHVHDDLTLALLYSAADVTVVPSRQENLPQTATEAQACGCPVAAFDCTGLPDAVAHRTSGYLARAFDGGDLAEGIRWIVDDAHHAALRAQARARAVALWSEAVVVPQYLALYAQVAGQRRAP